MRFLFIVLAVALTNTTWANCNIIVGHRTTQNPNNDSYSARDWKPIAKILREKGYNVRVEAFEGINGGQLTIVANDFEGEPDYELRSQFIRQDQMGYLIRGVKLGIYDHASLLLSSAKSFSEMSALIGEVYCPNHLKKALRQLKDCSELTNPL